jgi:hypothetical protein
MPILQINCDEDKKWKIAYKAQRGEGDDGRVAQPILRHIARFLLKPLFMLTQLLTKG